MWAGLGGGGRWHVVIGGDQEVPRHLGNVMKMFCFLGNYEEGARSDTLTPLILFTEHENSCFCSAVFAAGEKGGWKKGGWNKKTLLFPTAISHPQNRHFFVPGRSTTPFPPLYIRATHIRTDPVRRGSCTQAGRGGQSSMHHPPTRMQHITLFFRWKERFALEKK